MADLATQLVVISNHSQKLKETITNRSNLNTKIQEDLAYSNGFKFKMAGNIYTIEFKPNNSQQPIQIFTRKAVRVNRKSEELDFVHVEELDFICDLATGIPSFIFIKEPGWSITSFEDTYIKQLLDYTDNYVV